MNAAGERRIISSDDHIQEPPDLWSQRLPARLRPMAPRLVELPGGGQGFQIADQPPRPLGILVMAGRPPGEIKDRGLTWADVPKGSYDAAARLRDMDRDGIEATVLYPNICLDPMMDQVRLPPELAREVYRVYNDHLSDFCRTSPGRLAGAALVPMDTIEDAAAELQRAAALPGIRAALLPIIPPSGREWNDPYFEPFWAAAAETGLPLSIHAGRPRGLPNRSQVMRMRAGPAVYMHIGPFSTAETLAYIMWTGVFDRHPRLRIVSVEGGIGWLAFFKERAERVYRKHASWTAHGIRTRPSAWFGTNLFATFEEDAAGLHAVELIGAETLLWASDYPHSETTWPRSREAIAAQFRDVPAAVTDKIVGGNAARLYRL